MSLKIKKKDFDKIVMIGDRVLIKPKSPLEKTPSGLYLPPSIEKNEKVSLGYVVKVGPGYPIPIVNDDDESWKNKQGQMKYIPIQPQISDLAAFLVNQSYEILINEERYYICPNSSILMLVRDEDLLDN